MFEKMKEILVEQLNINADEVTLDTRFKEDLDADSLDLFDMLTTLEDEYNIEIPAEDMEDLTTVGKVIEYLKTRGLED